jgi:hypothetical protein
MAQRDARSPIDKLGVHIFDAVPSAKLLTHIMQQRYSRRRVIASLRGDVANRGPAQVWLCGLSRRRKGSERMALDCRVGCASSQ